MDLTLTFTSSEWICYNDEIHVQASSLDEIDAQLEVYFRKNFPAGNYDVNMYFDFDRFPQWHRQYMPHYFNRKISFCIN